MGFHFDLIERPSTFDYQENLFTKKLFLYNLIAIENTQSLKEYPFIKVHPKVISQFVVKIIPSIRTKILFHQILYYKKLGLIFFIKRVQIGFAN